nr:HID7 [Catharanthus roseus]
MVCTIKEVSSELLPFLQVYKDGSVERFLDSPFVPPCLNDKVTGVSSKDITISPDVTARIYLPQDYNYNKKFPLVVYFHGGGFCIDSAFSFLCHRYLNILVCRAKVIAISVEYRRAPENPLPIAYEDSWVALQWIAKQSIEKSEPWFAHYANFDRCFLGGDSAGANIAHHLAIRAGREGMEGSMKIYGVIMSHPYFLGTEPIGAESANVDRDRSIFYQTWKFVYPNAEGGFDNPLINPFSTEAPSLSRLGCSRLLVCVSEKDELRERGVKYFDEVKKSGWRGKMELFEVEGEEHCFHIFNLESQNAKILIKRFASFLNPNCI